MIRIREKEESRTKEQALRRGGEAVGLPLLGHA
jgi:hypothetical protein